MSGFSGLPIISACILLAVSGQALAVDSKNVIPAEAVFTEGALKKKETLFNKTNLIEVGERDGIKYHFYHSDGSGAFAGDKDNDIQPSFSRNKYWDLACSNDIMTDELTCSARLGDLAIFHDRGGDPEFFVLGEKYPGSRVSIRIDSGPVYSVVADSSFSAKQSKEMISSIKPGSRIAVRYVDPVNKQNVDSVNEVYGTQQVLDYLRWALSKIE